MEQDRYQGNRANPGQYGDDRDLFHRIWNRAEGEEEPQALAAEEKERGLAIANPPAGLGVVAGADRGYRKPAVLSNVESAQQPMELACLGPESAVYSEELQDFICRALADCKAYQRLAQCSDPGTCRILRSIAAEKHRNAKRLCTAYFLISGLRYWPCANPSPLPDSYIAALRRRFSEEQQSEADYLAAADQTADPCLQDLYLEIAAEEANHADLIRCILEMKL